MDLHLPAPDLVLGSTSAYRKQLLERLRWPFSVEAPNVDEAPHIGEPAAALATRLSLDKARSVAERRPQAIVIGSDQVAELDGNLIGKPGTHANAVRQLHSLQGRSVLFWTGVAVVCRERAFEQHVTVRVQVRFRALGDEDIERYVRAERPYDCAGSAKAEGLGIALLESIDSDDPTALIGLPLIATTRLLRAAGLDVLRGSDL